MAHSSVGLERRADNSEVGGSIPPAPTKIFEDEYNECICKEWK
jgi:hypothetical protein